MRRIVGKCDALSVTGIESGWTTACAIDTALTKAAAEPAATAVFRVLRWKYAALTTLFLLRQRATTGPSIASEPRGARDSAATAVKGVRRQIDAELTTRGLPHGACHHAHPVLTQAVTRAHDTALTAVQWIKIKRETQLTAGG